MASARKTSTRSKECFPYKTNSSGANLDTLVLRCRTNRSSSLSNKQDDVGGSVALVDLQVLRCNGCCFVASASSPTGSCVVALGTWRCHSLPTSTADVIDLQNTNTDKHQYPDMSVIGDSFFCKRIRKQRSNTKQLKSYACFPLITDQQNSIPWSIYTTRRQ